jgi:hypothetical protein
VIAESFWSVHVFILFIVHSSANSPDRPGACVQLLSSLPRAEQEGDIAGNLTVSCSRLSVLSYVTFLSRRHHFFHFTFRLRNESLWSQTWTLVAVYFWTTANGCHANGSSSVCVTFILFCCFRKPMTMFKSFSA